MKRKNARKSVPRQRRIARREFGIGPRSSECRPLGADHVIATEEEDLVAQVQSITGGKGARIVFDPVGGDYINTLAQATANGGTIFLYGMLSGKPTPFPLATFGRTIGMFGYTFLELRGTPEWEP